MTSQGQDSSTSSVTVISHMNIKLPHSDDDVHLEFNHPGPGRIEVHGQGSHISSGGNISFGVTVGRAVPTPTTAPTTGQDSDSSATLAIADASRNEPAIGGTAILDSGLNQAEITGQVGPADNTESSN